MEPFLTFFALSISHSDFIFPPSSVFKFFPIFFLHIIFAIHFNLSFVISFFLPSLPLLNISFSFFHSFISFFRFFLSYFSIFLFLSLLSLSLVYFSFFLFVLPLLYLSFPLLLLNLYISFSPLQLIF